MSGGWWRGAGAPSEGAPGARLGSARGGTASASTGEEPHVEAGAGQSSSEDFALGVHARVEDRDLDLDLDVRRGDVLAVVGANGSGKSSLLRLATGQLAPSAGTVTIGGVRVSGPGVHVPVHRRHVALLAQRALLFEHLDVLDNVAFGLRAARMARGPARVLARTHLDLVGCGDLAERRIWQVSGGQAQRIALARALATDPRLLLLDEPMAALDVSVAPAVRSLLRDVLAGPERTAVLVTHDVIDVLAVADRLAVIDAGRVVAEGDVAQLLTRPTSAFLADLVGVNLLAGVARGPDAIEVGGVVLSGVSGDRPLREGRPALATVAPSAVGVHLIDPGGSPRNHLSALVRTVEPRGSLVRVLTVLPSGDHMAADVTAAAALELDLRPGSEVRLVVKAAQVSLYEH